MVIVLVMVIGNGNGNGNGNNAKTVELCQNALVIVLVIRKLYKYYYI
jgi:hypothetical protein